MRRLTLPAILGVGLLVYGCSEGPISPESSSGASPFFPSSAAAAWVPAFTVIGTGAFSSPTVIDFEDAPVGLIGGFYSPLGVTAVNLTGGHTYDTGTGGGYSLTACNFYDVPGFPQGELHFDPPAIRAGFYITTNDPDNTTVTAYRNGSVVGSEYFDTGGAGAGGSFAGVEFGTLFDQLVIDPAQNANGAFCIDNLMFEVLVEVNIDIKPGSFPNSINPNSNGVVPVAILGSADFDVADVDVTTLLFGPAEAMPAHDLTDPFTYADHLQDVNMDGYLDLVSHYRQKDTGLQTGDAVACIEGATTGGTPIKGCDAVRVLKS